MTRSFQSLLFAALAPLALPVASVASDLDALRQSFLQTSASAAGPELQRYHSELSKLENALVAARDYSAALHVQRERLRVAAKIESFNTTAGGSPPVTATPQASGSDNSQTLDLSAATTGGGVTFDASSNTLRGWTATGAFAEWALPASHPSGGYEVELTYATAGDEPGTFVLKEAFYTLTRKTTPTSAPTEFRTHKVATLRMKPGPGPFRISAEAVPATGLFSLKSVRLLPSKP